MPPAAASTPYWEILVSKLQSLRKDERSEVKRLVTGLCSIKEFVVEDMASENGQLIQQLDMRLEAKHDKNPKEYSKFLVDIAKKTHLFATRGFLTLL